MPSHCHKETQLKKRDEFHGRKIRRTAASAAPPPTDASEIAIYYAMESIILVLVVIASCGTTKVQSLLTLGVSLHSANALVNVIDHTAIHSQATGYDSRCQQTLKLYRSLAIA